MTQSDPLNNVRTHSTALFKGSFEKICKTMQPREMTVRAGRGK